MEFLQESKGQDKPTTLAGLLDLPPEILLQILSCMLSSFLLPSDSRLHNTQVPCPS